jgi:ATP-binding cassette subfamily B multidrug efflux pump
VSDERPAPVQQPLNERGGPRMGGNVAIPMERSKDFRGSMGRLASRLGPDRPKLFVVFAFALVSVGCAVVGPKLLGHATDLVIAGVQSARSGGPGLDSRALAAVLVVLVALYSTSATLQYAQGYVLTGMVQRTVARLRGDVEAKLHRLPLKYLDSQPRGDVLSRVTNDIDNLAQTLQQSLSQLLTSSLTILGVLGMMLSVSPLLALVAVLTVPLSTVTIGAIARRSKPRFVAQWRHTGALNAQVDEAFTAHAIVKAFGRQRETEERFRKMNEELYEASFGAQVISGTVMPAMMFLGNVGFVAIAVVGGLRVAAGHISIGDVQAFIQYSRQFTQPITQVASMFNTLQSGVASAERVFELLDAPDQSRDKADRAPGAAPRGRVAFEHVSFSYVPGKRLISELSLVAEPGQTVAIVGPTGAGKTTLVNLLMRFYELDGGKITLDGRNIAEMPRGTLRANVGMVLQDTWLFGGTIWDNIAYGNPLATPEQIRAAARAAYVDRFVHSLPKGYETIIDDDGRNVSAGERQLLTIARAFVANPAILVLDEATSSVDTRTEVLIQNAMTALRKERTSFVIAHRLSTIRDAHVILVMDDGAIVEQGNHRELVARGGAYATLYNSQFAGAIADVV